MSITDHYKPIITLIVFLACLSGRCDCLAQNNQKTTTLLVTESTYNKYQMLTTVSFTGKDQLPKYSTGPEGNVLKLNFTIKTNRLANNTCYVYVKDKNQTDIGILRLDSKDTVNSPVFIEINNENDLLLKPLMTGKVTLNLEFSKKCFKLDTVPLISFFEAENLKDTAALRRQPRLMVNYKQTVKPGNSNWSQPDGNAQHSNSLDWQLDYQIEPALAAQKSYTYSDSIPGLVEDKISIYKTHPITYTVEDQKTIMTLWSSHATWDNKFEKMWEKEFKAAAPSQLPLIDAKGKMYYFSGVNGYDELVVMDMDRSGEEIDRKAFKDSINQSLKYLNISLANTINSIALGHDGSWYVPLTTGVAALTAYPELKVKWYYNKAETSYSPVSVSKDELIACFIEYREKPNESRSLVFINNLNGKELGRVDLDHRGLGTNDKLPPPVIQPLGERSFNVWAASSRHKAKYLTAVGVSYDYRANATVTAFETKKKHDETSTAGLTRPVVTPNENASYFFNKTENVFYRYDKRDSLKRFPAKAPRLKDKDVFLGAYFGQITQANSRVYDGYSYAYTEEQLSQQNTIPNYWINQSFGPPVFSPDGSYYTISKGWLYRFYPIAFKDDGKEEKNIGTILRNQTTYGHPRKLSMKAQEVTSNTQAVFYSKSFRLPKGLSVNKGAELRFKTLTNQ